MALSSIPVQVSTQRVGPDISKKRIPPPIPPRPKARQTAPLSPMPPRPSAAALTLYKSSAIQAVKRAKEILIDNSLKIISDLDNYQARMMPELLMRQEKFKKTLADDPTLRSSYEKYLQSKGSDSGSEKLTEGKEIMCFQAAEAEKAKLSDIETKAARLIQHAYSGWHNSVKSKSLKEIETEAQQSLARARAQEIRFSERGEIGYDEKIVDNFQMDFATPKNNNCERILVDFKHDKVLKATLGKIKNKLDETPGLTDLAKLEIILQYVKKIYSNVLFENALDIYESVVKLRRADGKTTALIPLGKTIQAHAGICRHRALLTKLIADEVGLNASLVVGKKAVQGKGKIANVAGKMVWQGEVGAHAWNQFKLGDGKTYLVDVTAIDPLLQDISDLGSEASAALVCQYVPGAHWRK